MESTAFLLAAMLVGFAPTNTQLVGNVRFLAVPSEVMRMERLLPSA
jgi:hypothetical protein